MRFDACAGIAPGPELWGLPRCWRFAFQWTESRCLSSGRRPCGSVLVVFPLVVFSSAGCALRLLRLLNGDLGLVRKTVSTLADDLLARLQTGNNLRLVAGLDAGFDTAALGQALCIHDHDLRVTAAGVQ